MAIADQLARSNPSNAGWQHDLAVSYAKIGNVLRRMGAAADALNTLQQGQAIMVRMARLSPDNATWKNDLAWFNEQIAYMKPLH